eukprot:Pgem_evm1s19231
MLTILNLIKLLLFFNLFIKCYCAATNSNNFNVKFYCDEGFQLQVLNRHCVSYSCPNGYSLTLQLNPATNQYDRKVCFARDSYTLRSYIKNTVPCTYGTQYYRNTIDQVDYCLSLCYEETHTRNGNKCHIKNGIENIISPLEEKKPLKCLPGGNLVSIDPNDN